MEIVWSQPLSDEHILRALLQYGVFIDGGLGSSNEGIPTQKLIYRKLFAPVFPTTLSSRDSFSWTRNGFHRFLAEARRSYYRTYKNDLLAGLEGEIDGA